MLPSVGCRSKCVINIPFGNGGVLSVRRTTRFPMKSKHSQNACVCVQKQYKYYYTVADNTMP